MISTTLSSLSRRSRLSRARRVSLVALAAGVLVLAGGSTLEAQRGGSARYDIRFHRPATVGARARVEVNGSKRTTLERRNGRAMETMRDDLTQVRFVAEERVVAIGSTGKPTTVQYTIEAFEVTEGGAPTTALPAGTVLTVERATQPGADPRMHVNGRDVAPEVAAALGIVVSRRSSDTSDDDVFGSTTPRRVGERWGINAALAQREMAASGAPEMRLRGDVRATELSTVDSLPCIVLTATMRGQLAGIPSLPPTATFRAGTMEATMSGAFPLDGTSRPPTGSVSMVMDVTFSVSGATPAATQNLHMVVREERTEHVTPLP